MTETPVTTWTAVCPVAALVPDRGAAALVGTHQIALFLLSTGELYAVGHRDPFSGANVMARGLVGTRGDVPTVASPILKQVFDLRSGLALDYPEISLDAWDARVVDGIVEVRQR